jgi:SNF2 family DNA or RNA helicase
MSVTQPWTPRPYQLTSLEFMVKDPQCGLLLDPGLGKTSTTLAAFDFLKSKGLVNHALVVAPLRVAKTVWPVEGKKWSDFNHLTICDLTEKTKGEREALLKGKFDIYVINPESLTRLLDLDPWGYMPFDVLVVDESTKFKDSQTQRFKALKKFLHQFPRRHILTGTPAPNGLADLFGQMYVVDRGATLGKYITHFRQRYMYQSGDGFTWLLARGAAELIYEAVRPKLLRLMAKDHLEMPELVDNLIEVELPKDVMAKYKALEKTFLMDLGSDSKLAVFNSAAKGTKLRQIANGFIYDESHVAHRQHAQKIEALEELLEELQGRPLLLCYEFIEDGKWIQERFPQAVNISESKNVLKTVERFNAGLIPLLIGHPKSMGHGLNLQESCKDIAWFGITWDLELYQQAIARIWRQGQPSPIVNNHLIVAKGTKDLQVAKVLADKHKTQEGLNNAIRTLPSQAP